MQGVFTALVTPWNKQNQIDLNAFRNILQDQVAAGISGVVLCGTTGESPTLTLAERKTLITIALEELKNSKTSVIAGTGTNNTEESVELSIWANQQGVDAIMLVTPYYNKPTQSGLAAHFQKIADAVSCEVILYNVPGRTGVSLTPETIAQLAEHPRINTLKEATGNVAFTSEIFDALSLRNQKLDILSGDDATFLPLLSVGATGVISVASNLFPRGMVALYESAKKGKNEEALRLQKHFYPLFRDLFIEANPIPIKHAMAEAGWCQPNVRLPLMQISASNAAKLQLSLTKCGILKGTPA